MSNLFKEVKNSKSRDLKISIITDDSKPCVKDAKTEELREMMNEMLRSLIYQDMCSSCENAKKCHDECITCGAFDKAVANATKEAKDADN